MTPTDEPDFNELDQARCNLREGIESSREMVRQSRLLLELSECAGAATDADDFPVAN